MGSTRLILNVAQGLGGRVVCLFRRVRFSFPICSLCWKVRLGYTLMIPEENVENFTLTFVY